MVDSAQAIQQSRNFVNSCQYGDAETLLTSALAAKPEDPNLNAELGLLYCLGQKEFKAAKLLPLTVGAERHQELANRLRDYFYCRKLLTDKYSIADEKGENLRNVVSKYASGKPNGLGIKLSACLIVKNEEKQLERCLQSLQGAVDEIVVVDTGSTDRTLEIAEKFGAVIGHFDWCDDFAAARNESLRLATGDWALWIDADEELNQNSVACIREGLIRPQFGGYFFKIINFMDGATDANTYVHTAVRLFRRMPGVSFTGRIHEQILGSFEELGLVPATLNEAVLHHYGYQPEVMREKDKVHRTITMLLREVEESPKEPFHWFNLANAYSVAMKPTEAEPAARKCIDLIPAEAPYGPAVFQILTSALVAQGRPAEALPYCSLAQEKGFGTIINEFERAHALFELGRLNEALGAIDTCLSLEWPIELTGDFGIKTYKAHVLRGQILTALGRFEEAETAIDYALTKDPHFSMGVFAKAVLCERTGHNMEAHALYRRCSGSVGLEICLKFAGRTAAKAEEYEQALTAYQQYWNAHPGDLEAWLGCVQACEAAGQYSKALQFYEGLGAEQMPGSDLILNWGRCLEALGEREGALHKFAEAIERNPESANAYFNCGDLLYKMGHFEQAAHIYQLGLKRDTANAQAWFVLGNCFAKLNISTGATTSYEQALQIQPNHREARLNLEAVTSLAA
jgi:tetratricopeptide (TPR) repeat protein